MCKIQMLPVGAYKGLRQNCEGFERSLGKDFPPDSERDDLDRTADDHAAAV